MSVVEELPHPLWFDSALRDTLTMTVVRRRGWGFHVERSVVVVPLVLDAVL